MLKKIIEGFNGVSENASTDLNVVVTEMKQGIVCKLYNEKEPADLVF
jgi:hypothetical protein